jgi:hypothetical protein
MKEWKEGYVDKWLAPAAVWGVHGHGAIGYSCDQFRQYNSFSEAKQPILEVLEPFFNAHVSQEMRLHIAERLYMQRTRNRFPEGEPIRPAPPQNLRVRNSIARSAVSRQILNSTDQHSRSLEDGSKSANGDTCPFSKYRKAYLSKLIKLKEYKKKK